MMASVEGRAGGLYALALGDAAEGDDAVSVVPPPMSIMRWAVGLGDVYAAPQAVATALSTR